MSIMFEFTVTIIWYCGHMPMLICYVSFVDIFQRFKMCMGAVYLLITMLESNFQVAIFYLLFKWLNLFYLLFKS